LWDAAKARQRELDEKAEGLWQRKRPQYLLSGLLRCGQCGGGYSKINTNRYGCSSARNKGASVCTNKTTIAREVLEATVLGALQTRLMDESLVQVFCEEYTRHMNALLREQDSARGAQAQEAARLQKERENIIRAIKDGVPADLVKCELEALCARQDELKGLLASAQEPARPLLHPSMARRYRQEIRDLREALNDEKRRGEASQLLRSLIDKVVLRPTQAGALSIDLYGDLAGILEIASQSKSEKDKPMKTERKNKNRHGSVASNDNHLPDRSVQLVAGAGFEPATFGL